MSEMINPITIDTDRNVCPFCGGEIAIIQHESTLIELDKKGIPECAEVLKFDSKGICKKCYKEIAMDKDGLCYKEHCSYLDAKKELAIEESQRNPFYK